MADTRTLARGNSLEGWTRSACVVLLLVAVLSAMSARPVLGQPCDRLRPADSGPTGYQQRSDPQRCEGMYQENTAGEGDLDFLSLVRGGAIQYDLTTDTVRTIAVPDVGALHALNVNVRVVNVTDQSPDSPHYRLDAQIPSAKSIDWPLSAVVVRAQLQPDDLGALGCIGSCDEHSPIYVPVSVSREKSGASRDPTVATFRFGNGDLQNVRWRLYPGTGCAPGPDSNTTAGMKPRTAGTVSLDPSPNGASLSSKAIIPAGTLFRITIDNSPSPRCLHISGNIASTSDRVEEDIRLFAPP